MEEWGHLDECTYVLEPALLRGHVEEHPQHCALAYAVLIVHQLRRYDLPHVERKVAQADVEYESLAFSQ